MMDAPEAIEKIFRTGESGFHGRRGKSRKRPRSSHVKKEKGVE
jgi:hypothetical protein